MVGVDELEESFKELKSIRECESVWSDANDDDDAQSDRMN